MKIFKKIGKFLYWALIEDMSFDLKVKMPNGKIKKIRWEET